MSAQRISRRRFIQTTGAAAGMLTIGVHSNRAAEPSKSPNEKLNIGMIGTANQAEFSISSLKHENLAAFCDVDEVYLGKASTRFPKAMKFQDFRKLIEQKDLDAVAICTPDHIHAPATLMALLAGKHVYCEKPLTHTVEEAQLVVKAANANKELATQMGNQIHASDNYRRVVELIQGGAIGKVKEVHTFVHRGWSGNGRPEKTDPVPKTLNWDLWLGPAPKRPFTEKAYHPGNWRRFWDFGGGTLGDMGCHHIDLPMWALDLRGPTNITSREKSTAEEAAPAGQIIDYHFAAPKSKDELHVGKLKLTWYGSESVPKEIEGIKISGDGSLFVGEKGILFADYSRNKLYPEADFKDFKPPQQSIPKSVGHHQEWINACKTGSPTLCNFDYAGRLTATVLLGNAAFRANTTIHWDAETMTVMDAKSEPHAFISKGYRKGWELPKIS
jgi:predicted dehydrogenase